VSKKSTLLGSAAHATVSVAYVVPELLESLQEATSFSANQLREAPRAEQPISLAWAHDAESASSARYLIIGGIAIIPVEGMLISGLNSYWAGYYTGYNWIQDRLTEALRDPAVTGIALAINSGGGHCSGAEELASIIYESRAIKPITALAEGYMCSAAYYIGSAAERIIATTSTIIGSIGVVASHLSYARMAEDEGIKITMFYRGDRKLDGHPLVDLSDSAKAAIDKRTDEMYQFFVDAVGRHRGDKLTTQAARDTEAATFLAAEALDKGLIDVVATSSTAFLGLLASSNSSNTGIELMSQTPAPEAAAPAAPVVDTAALSAAAATAERTRISAIMTSEHAAAMPKLAEHLAYNTTTPAADAQATLAAAVASAPAPVAAPAAAANPFVAAMGATPNVDPGADSASTGEAVKPSRAQATMALRAPKTA
jgi:capsid assembly protease